MAKNMRTAKKMAAAAEQAKAPEIAAETVAVAEEKVVEAVAETPVETKTAAKKPAAKKSPAKKTAAKTAAKKSDVSAELFVQYQGIQVSYSELVEKAKAFAGVADPKTISIYVKPEDYKVYYVIDGDNIGDFAL